jgi:hypothetical protein
MNVNINANVNLNLNGKRKTGMDMSNTVSTPSIENFQAKKSLPWSFRLRQKLALFFLPEMNARGWGFFATILFYVTTYMVVIFMPIFHYYYQSWLNLSLTVKSLSLLALLIATVFLPLSFLIPRILCIRDFYFKTLTYRALEQKMDANTYAQKMFRFASLVTSHTLREMSHRLIGCGCLNHYLALQDYASKYHLDEYSDIALTLEQAQHEARIVMNAEPDTIHSRRAYDWRDFLPENQASPAVYDLLRISFLLARNGAYKEKLTENKVIYPQFLNTFLMKTGLIDNSIIYQVWFEYSCLNESWSILTKLHLKEKLEYELSMNDNDEENQNSEDDLLSVSKI